MSQSVHYAFQLGIIYKACDNPKIRRAMFSATFAHQVEEWCRLNLDNVLQLYVGARSVICQMLSNLDCTIN